MLIAAAFTRYQKFDREFYFRKAFYVFFWRAANLTYKVE